MKELDSLKEPPKPLPPQIEAAINAAQQFYENRFGEFFTEPPKEIIQMHNYKVAHLEQLFQLIDHFNIDKV